MDGASTRKTFLDDLEHWATEQPDAPWLVEDWTSRQTSISRADGAHGPWKMDSSLIPLSSGEIGLTNAFGSILRRPAIAFAAANRY